MRNDTFRARRNRAGSALVVVMGLLALLLIAAVAFAIYTRTDRIAAGNYLNDVTTRALLSVSLNRAMQDVETSVGDLMYPPWDVRVSPTNVTDGVDSSLLTDANLLAWVPQSVPAMTNGLMAGWIPVGNDSYVAYAILNCSGLLDANYAGGSATRGVGTNPACIQLGYCSEVANSGLLTNDRPYETIQELMYQGTNSGALRSGSKNFVTFSYFPWQYAENPTGTMPCAIGGDENALLTNRATIVQALINSGIQAGDAPYVFDALLDYVDGDDVPRNLASMCTEAVPMFNEVQVSYSLVLLSNNIYRIKGKMDVEWYYPFITPKPDSDARRFSVKYAVSFIPSAPGFPVPPTANGVMDSNYPIGAPCGKTLCPFTGPGADYSAFAGRSVTVTGRVSLLMRQSDLQVVDAVPTNTVKEFEFPLVLQIPVSPANVDKSIDKEVNDPRYNWDPDNWRVSATPTLLNTNNVTTAWRISRSNSVDIDTQMYVANRSLQSVAELSYLPRAANGSAAFWTTIRIVPTPWNGIDRVLDYFRMSDTPVGRGFVNPNTRSLAVLEATFGGMSADDYPDDPNGAPVSAPDVADAWLRNASVVSDLSDLAAKCSDIMTNAPFNASGFKRESIIRNTVGLLHSRQNYFIIMLSAQRAKVFGSSRVPMSSIRAVAEVWRDPIASADGTHFTNIRMLMPVNRQ